MGTRVDASPVVSVARGVGVEMGLDAARTSAYATNAGLSRGGEILGTARARSGMLAPWDRVVSALRQVC